MSTLDSFLSKKRHRNVSNSLNTAFVAPQNTVFKKSISTPKQRSKKILQTKNSITQYFKPIEKPQPKEEEEEVIYFKVRKTIPIMDAWKDVVKEYEEEEEEPVYYTVRHPKPISAFWEAMLNEFSEDEPKRDNKRKYEETDKRIKRQKTTTTDDLCRFMNEQLYL